MVGLVLLVIVAVLVIWAVGSYNRLVALRNQVANGWRQIDVQLKRRHDLIPNLVNTVRDGEVLHIPSWTPHQAEALEDTFELDVFSPIRQDWVRGEE